MPQFSLSFRLWVVFLVAMLLGAEDIGRGERLLQAYWKGQIEEIGSRGLNQIRSREEWEKQRPELRRQLLDMLGLWPLPARTDLKSMVTGQVETEWYRVEKVAFQSMPGLYVTANLFLPLKVTRPAPTILYLCGHSPVIVDGVSHGNKVAYQHHGAWFAEHGYVCLVLDTLQLGELQGLHHGTHHLGMWWWQGRGYTPAGIECWNAMRALDYLETRKEVDAKRFGVTGRSGGGAGAWWLAAADDRPQCIVPVAGIADLRAHLFDGERGRFLQGVIDGHCDCMYFINRYRWDFDQVMALCAPRPVLLGNSDTDDIFPVGGYRRPAARARRIYEFYGAAERFDLAETQGGHVDTPELRQAAYAWMNRWLGNKKADLKEISRPLLKPEQLRVFQQPPRDALNARIHEIQRRPVDLPLPDPQADPVTQWRIQSEALRESLRSDVFRGWPTNPGPYHLQAAEDLCHQGLRLRAFDFVSEENVPLRFWLLSQVGADRLQQVEIKVLDESGWQDAIQELDPVFRGSLQGNGPDGTVPSRANGRGIRSNDRSSATVWVVPRGIGPTRWIPAGADGKAADAGIRRRFALLGQTLDGQRVWDIYRATLAIRSLPDCKEAAMVLEGKGEIGIDALYAFLLRNEANIEKLHLIDPPASHDQGPALLNVRSYLDIPQVVALAMTRPIRITVHNPLEVNKWDWPIRLQKMLGTDRLKIDGKGE